MTRLDLYLSLQGKAAASARHYEVGPILGRGRCGTVFAGVDAHGTPVAIKLLAPSTRAARTRVRFDREARALLSVRSPHVLRALDYSGLEIERPYLICERIDGETVAQRVKREMLSERELWTLAHDAAQGLQAIHAAGLLHRDIKPANIMRTPNGRFVLLDLGFAISPEATPLTERMGTAEFSSPEQVRGEALDARSDLFSLGATIYYAATQVHPFCGEDMLATLEAVVDHEPLPLDTLIDCSAALVAFAQMLLAKSPSDRRLAWPTR